ncbi:DUF1003 domain-containing protein [Cohnella kolymensis]|uniref:DUF1003 domain-containing protein n=1 Tax=Cohnella kolymensis TaxID=1590652 RepID=UPI0006964792|nr:DUF1003 domain-containing protein [Cohnella kolymensis]
MTETQRAHSVSDPEPQSEELLMQELEKYPKHKMNKDDVYRVARMVNEYQGKIKAHLHEQQEKKAGRMDRFADRVANFGGSWRFVAALTVILTVWLIWDHGRLSLFMLSFSLSIFTVFQAALIQMSQNRQAMKDKQEQMLDIAINYTAEQENLEIQKRLTHIDKRLHGLEKNGDG